MRPINEKEREIVQKKSLRMKKELSVTGIEYHNLFPRTTLCKIVGSKESYGVAMRSKHDVNNQEIGEVLAFVRSLNAL